MFLSETKMFLKIKISDRINARSQLNCELAVILRTKHGAVATVFHAACVLFRQGCKQHEEREQCESNLFMQS